MPGDAPRGRSAPSLALPGLALRGIGTNLACQSGVDPRRRNMAELSALATSVEIDVRHRPRHRVGRELGQPRRGRSTRGPTSDGSTTCASASRCCSAASRSSAPPIEGCTPTPSPLVGEVIESKAKPSAPLGRPGPDRVRPVVEDRRPGPGRAARGEPGDRGPGSPGPRHRRHRRARRLRRAGSQQRPPRPARGRLRRRGGTSSVSGSTTAPSCGPWPRRSSPTGSWEVGPTPTRPEHLLLAGGQATGHFRGMGPGARRWSGAVAARTLQHGGSPTRGRRPEILGDVGDAGADRGQGVQEGGQLPFGIPP